MVVKELYFEERKCAQRFIETHTDNVHIMDIRDNPRNPEYCCITIDIEPRSPNVLVSVAGSPIRKKVYGDNMG
jgi:hypothetical protein